jgi:L-threonylcarbamoyladenylate synthase
MTILSTDLEKAASFLKEGKLVAFPTETVYGLGGNALSDNAVAGIYAAKARPNFNPLIVHVASLEQAHEYVEFSETALQLAQHFWPGPLTLVLPRKKDCKLSLLVSAGLDSVAIRIPGNDFALRLLQLCELPLAAPSANRSGRISPTEASHVMEELTDRIAMVLDGGSCHVGIESTVVDITGKNPVLLRPGSITIEELGKLVKNITPATEATKITGPGMLKSHYAPNHSIRLDATDVKQDEGLLAFGSDVPAGARMTENLSPTGNLEVAATNLFMMLRKLDAGEIAGIAVMPIPHTGLGVAINDRLQRAAAPKEDAA